MPQGIYSSYGMPSNYTSNPMYQYYMMQMLQQQQQQALFAQQQQQQQLQTQTYYAQQAAQEQAALQQQTVGVQQQERVAVPAHMAAQTVQQPQQVDGDGKDDGKISWGKKLKNFGKGIGNFFKGMVCDENGRFSLKRTLTTVGIAAGAVVLSVATYGAAVPYLAAAGVTMATYQTGKGIYKACTAKTDREAEQAWQEIGSGTTALVVSIAGAKGALKSSGAAVPKGNVITSNLRATGECFKIAGKGVWNAKGAMLHPMQTARSIGGYWTSTAKPNLQQAFSYKNWRNNYTETTRAGIDKNISKLDAKIQDTNAKLTELRAANSEGNLGQISKLESNLMELQNERVLMSQQRAYLSEGGAEGVVSNLKNDLAVAKDRLANATESEKAILSADIKSIESQLKFYESNLKLENAYRTTSRADAVTKAWETRMKQPGVTEWQKGQMQAHIKNAKAYAAGAKNTLRISNMKIAAQQHLPNVGLAYGSSYLAGAAPQTINDENAQLYGFESKDQMIEAAAQYGLTAEQLADAIDQQLAAQGLKATDVAQQQADAQAQAEALAQQQAASQQYNPYASNPYGQYAYSQPAQYMGDNTFRFNELYQSPYPDMI